LENIKQYYINRIINLAAENNIYEYTVKNLSDKEEYELIAIWDTLRWKYGDLATHNRQ